MLKKELFINFVYSIKNMYKYGFSDEQIRSLLHHNSLIPEFEPYFVSALGIAKQDNMEEIIDTIYSHVDIFEELETIKREVYSIERR